MKLSTTPTLLLLLLASTSRIHVQSCSVCGDGKEVANPDALIQMPHMSEAATCGLVQDAGYGNIIPINECALLPIYIQYFCGCVDIGGGLGLGLGLAPVSFAPVDPEEVDPCEEIPPFEQKCDNTPSQIVLRYTGNGCDVSSNQQGDLFFCDDFQGGPTKEGCMVIRDIRAGEKVYYYGPVVASDGMNIVLNAESVGDTKIEPNMNVTIYRDCDAQKLPQGILETMVFHTSCSEDLFLRDTFGAIEIVGFENGQQGSVNCENTVPSPTDAPVVPPTDAPIEKQKKKFKKGKK